MTFHDFDTSVQKMQKVTFLDFENKIKYVLSNTDASLALMPLLVCLELLAKMFS